MPDVREVPANLLIRANLAVVEEPRGDMMFSIVKALSKEASPEDVLAVSYRLRALAFLARGVEDIAGFTMSVVGKEYKLINKAAFNAAAICPLSLRDTMSEVQFDRDEFLKLALSFAEAEGNG